LFSHTSNIPPLKGRRIATVALLFNTTLVFITSLSAAAAYY
jgi:hypothetical protein